MVIIILLKSLLLLCCIGDIHYRQHTENERLQEELKNLKTVERPAIIAAVVDSIPWRQERTYTPKDTLFYSLIWFHVGTPEATALAEKVFGGHRSE